MITKPGDLNEEIASHHARALGHKVIVEAIKSTSAMR